MLWKLTTKLTALLNHTLLQNAFTRPIWLWVSTWAKINVLIIFSLFRVESEELSKTNIELTHLSVESEQRASSAPPATCLSPPLSPQLVVTPCSLPDPTDNDTCITIEPPQTNSPMQTSTDDNWGLPSSRSDETHENHSCWKHFVWIIQIFRFPFYLGIKYNKCIVCIYKTHLPSFWCVFIKCRQL